MPNLLTGLIAAASGLCALAFFAVLILVSLHQPFPAPPGPPGASLKGLAKALGKVESKRQAADKLVPPPCWTLGEYQCGELASCNWNSGKCLPSKAATQYVERNGAPRLTCQRPHAPPLYVLPYHVALIPRTGGGSPDKTASSRAAQRSVKAMA